MALAQDVKVCSFFCCLERLLSDRSDVRGFESEREEEIFGDCRAPAISRVDEGEYCSAINSHLKVVAINVGLVSVVVQKASGIDGRPDQLVLIRPP
jgi:hypothetical protein